MIPAPEAFLPYAQFIIHDQAKRPLSPHTLAPGDPHDPANWMDYETAKMLADATGHGVGFVFTAADPFFFIDIDGAWDGERWSDLASQVCRQFAGCYVEVSRSGRGLHIFGICHNPPPHRCKNTALGLELYTSGRYVALTGSHAQGDAGHLADLGGLVSQYLIPDAPTAADSVEWTDGPCPEWSGPTDDAELLRRMLRSTGAASMFGGRASIADLWAGDVSALSRAYPSTSGDIYDRSSADAALIAHLAWWTGRDCERIDRLFRQSGLMRDKWADRGDYRRRSILGAVRRSTSVLQQGKRPDPPASLDSPPQPGGADPNHRSGYQLLTVSQQVDLFRGCVYVRDAHRVFVPDGGMLKPEQFRAMFGGYVYALDTEGSKTTRNAWEALTESQGYAFPRAHGTCFRPELPPATVVIEEGSPLVNTYVPVAVARRRGDPGRFLELAAKLIPDPVDRETLLQYLAACVQMAGRKFQWTPLVQGVQGNGKTFLGACVAHAVGWRYSHTPNASDLGNKFNAWVLGKLFIIVEEIYVADRAEVIEALKPLITNEKIEIQGKGANQLTGDNRANFLMFSNHKNAVRVAGKDRRYCIFYTAQQELSDLARDGMTGRYFAELWDWARAEGFAVAAEYLATRPITPEFRTQLMYRAPVTTSTGEAIRLSRGGLEQEIEEAIAEGRHGFRGGWVSSLALDHLINQRLEGGRIPRNLRREILKSLGYLPHPGLPGGRANNIVPEDGGKPVLYTTAGHTAIGITGAPAIVRAYTDSQKTEGV